MKTKHYVIISLIIALIVTTYIFFPRKYQIDGVFSAYRLEVVDEEPLLIIVSAHIDRHKVVDISIDHIESSRTSKDRMGVATYYWKWASQTRKEIVSTGNVDLDWIKQINLIEESLLNELDFRIITNDNGEIINIPNVSLKNHNYDVLAEEALRMAENNSFQVVLPRDHGVYISKATVNRWGKVTHIFIDFHESLVNVSSGTFSWREKTNQEYGDAYNMKGALGYRFNIDGWVVSGTCDLEWYQQVNLISTYIVENGWNDGIEPLFERSGTYDGTSQIDELSSVTIRTNDIFILIRLLFETLDESLG